MELKNPKTPYLTSYIDANSIPNLIETLIKLKIHT